MEKEVADLEAQVAKLEKETEQLAAKELAKQNNTKQNNGHVKQASAAMAQSNAIQFKVSYKMNIVPEEGSYILIIDSQLPIREIIMQSKQNIDILDIKDNVAKITRILDIKDPSIASLNLLTIDGDDSNDNQFNRIEMRIRTSEGQLGNI